MRATLGTVSTLCDVEVFELRSQAAPQAAPGRLNPAEKPRIALQAVIEPVVLGLEPDEDAGGLPVPRERASNLLSRWRMVVERFTF
ncbi:MAG TPA: hypothetical protein VIY49_33515 [Bryobacteraceae bacterium]